MALPDKHLPLIHYDTKDEYEAKVAAMTTEERAQYDAFYLGFVADTREFHTQGNTYKCGRGWVLSDITGAQAGANEFVSNVCAGDTLLMSNNELVLLMGKTLNDNIITVSALSPSGGYLLTFSTDDNGANWHLSATNPRSFVQAELMYGTSAMMAEMGGIYETEGGLVIAFPSSSQEVKDFADYTLQAEITDLPDIRSGANKGKQAMEIINSRDNVAAQPYKVKYGITANGGKVSDNAASIKALRGDTAVWNQYANITNFTAITQYGVTVSYDNGKLLCRGTYTGGEDKNFYIGNFTAPNAINIPQHKYLCQIFGNKNMGGTIYGYGGSATFDDAAIITSQQEGQLQLVPRIKSETEIGTIIDETIFFRISDLTLMFGAGNEPTTVEEYYERKPIVADESAYNEGQLASFGPTWGVRCSVGGSNLVWEQELGSTWGVNSGDLTVNGDSIIVTATGAWPSLYTVAPFKQGHKYLVVCGIQSPLTDTVVIGTPNNGNAQYQEGVQANTDTTIVAFLDCTESYNEFYIYPNWNVAASGEEFTITRPQRYDLTETFGAGNEPTTIDELRQHLPRITPTKHFDISGIFPHGLNKVGSVRDEMYYDSARRTWVAVHRVGVVDLGLQEEWYYRPDLNISESGAPIYTSVFVTRVYGKKNDNTNNLACSRYPIKEGYINDADKVCNDMPYTNLKDVNIVDSSFTDVDSFRAAMQGVLLCYELAEPVIEDVPFFDSFYNAYEGGTEEIVADIPTTAMDADIAYQYDDRGRIDFIYSKIKSL